VPTLQDLTPALITVAIFLLVGFPVHEFSHAAVAYLQGDATAKLLGRMTLNPIVHFDPIGGLMTILSVVLGGFLIGWAKPTPVNTANLRDRRNGEVIVALAGPASNLVMAVIGAFVFRLLEALGVELRFTLAGSVIYLFVLFNVLLAIFNFLPIPPLDGSTLLYRILSPRQVWQVRPFLTQYGIFILLAFVLIFSRVLGDVIQGVANALVGA
jgi:Zn-dependent protease